jgi:hypothetical protein
VDAAELRAVVAGAPAVHDERIRVQTELLETADRIRDLEDELADLARTDAPRGEHARVTAALTIANQRADALEIRDRALTARLERIRAAQAQLDASGIASAPAMASEDRLAVVRRVLAICERAGEVMRRVRNAHLQCQQYEGWLAFRRRYPGRRVTDRVLVEASRGDPGTLRRELFDALHVARKELPRLIDASADVIALYPSASELFVRDRLELLLAEPSENVEQAPLAFASWRIAWLLETIEDALEEECKLLESSVSPIAT